MSKNDPTRPVRSTKVPAPFVPTKLRIIPLPSKQFSIYFVFFLKIFLSFKNSLYFCKKYNLMMDITHMDRNHNLFVESVNLRDGGF